LPDGLRLSPVPIQLLAVSFPSKVCSSSAAVPPLDGLSALRGVSSNTRCEPHVLRSTVSVRSVGRSRTSPAPPSPRGHRWCRPGCFHLGRLQPHLASPMGCYPHRARPWRVERLNAHRLRDDLGVAPQPPFGACVDAMTGLATSHRACALPSASLRTANTGSVSGGHPARGDLPRSREIRCCRVRCNPSCAAPSGGCPPSGCLRLQGLAPPTSP